MPLVDRAQVLASKVLVVDDRPGDVLLLERTLRAAGYSSVTSILDPRLACELHRANGYDLILLDVEMPAVDGIEVLRGLKEVEGDGYLSVLVLTAHPDRKECALAAGARDFVAKPFVAVELLSRVYSMLELRLLESETGLRTS